MAKLGLAMAAASALACAPLAAAPPASAEEALELQKSLLRSNLGLDCDREAAEIVVCGRRGPDPNRLPLPVERLAGDREHLLPGELPRARPSYDSCVIACPRGSGIDVFKAVDTSIKIVRHILGKDD